MKDIVSILFRFELEIIGIRSGMPSDTNLWILLPVESGPPASGCKWMKKNTVMNNNINFRLLYLSKHNAILLNVKRKNIYLPKKEIASLNCAL